MKQIFYLLMVVCGFCLSANAQNNARQTNPTSKQQANVSPEIANAIHDCPDLQKQLTQLFGKDYSVNDSKVIAQLNKNIADVNQNRYVRKSSLKAIYGTDYINKLYLIDNQNQNK